MDCYWVNDAECLSLNISGCRDVLRSSRLRIRFASLIEYFARHDRSGHVEKPPFITAPKRHPDTAPLPLAQTVPPALRLMAS